MTFVPTLYLDNLGVCTAAVSCGGMHPSALHRSTLLSQRALLLLNTPAALEPGVRLQTHPTAVPQSVALVQVCWGRRTKHDQRETELTVSISQG